jgi:hypothetical protein
MRKKNILLTNWMTRKEHGAYSLVDKEVVILCRHFRMIMKEYCADWVIRDEYCADRMDDQG